MAAEADNPGSNEWLQCHAGSFLPKDLLQHSILMLHGNALKKSMR